MLEKKKCAEMAYRGWKEIKEEEIKKKSKEYRYEKIRNRWKLFSI